MHLNTFLFSAVEKGEIPRTVLCDLVDYVQPDDTKSLIVEKVRKGMKTSTDS